jgi:tetratricopeptide (TPR) repeat protein
LEPFSWRELLEEPHLAHLLSGALYRTERHEDARKLNALLAEPCRRRGRDKLYRQRLNLEAVLNVEAGNLAKATTCLTEVLRHSFRSRDFWTMADATMNLGMIAWIECRWMDALVSLQRSLSAYIVLGNSYMVAGCYQNLALTYREMSRFADSHESFEQAIRYYLLSGEGRELEMCAVEAERALLIGQEGDLIRAEAMARRALATAQRFAAGRREAEALRVMGIILARLNRTSEAKFCLELALEKARSHSNVLLEAEVLEELARMDSSQSRNHARQAAKLYRQIGAEARALRLLT